MINSARIEMTIVPIDPLLVKSGHATVGGVDMAFVRTYRHGEKEEPFVPGSSIKGMIRSHAEKICRSLRETPVPVCLPYLKPGDESAEEARQASCGLRLEKFKKDKRKSSIPSPDVYSLSCLACRLFGCHSAIGRFAASDAYLAEDFKKNFVLEIRDGVAIDRFTGGAAKGAKYDLEVLTRGEFETVIEIRNFERWQLGLVGLILRDMEEGLVRLGFGKSRGLGRFKGVVSRFDLAYYRPPERFSGLGALCSEKEQNAYGFFPESDAPSAQMPAFKQNGLRYECDIAENWKDILEPGVADLQQFIKTVQWPQAIEKYCERG